MKASTMRRALSLALSLVLALSLLPAVRALDVPTEKDIRLGTGRVGTIENGGTLEMYVGQKLEIYITSPEEAFGNEYQLVYGTGDSEKWTATNWHYTSNDTSAVELTPGDSSNKNGTVEAIKEGSVTVERTVGIARVNDTTKGKIDELTFRLTIVVKPVTVSIDVPKTAEVGKEITLTATMNTEELQNVQFGWIIKEPNGETHISTQTAKYTPKEAGTFEVSLGVSWGSNFHAEAGPATITVTAVKKAFTVAIVDATGRTPGNTITVGNGLDLQAKATAANSTGNLPTINYTWKVEPIDLTSKNTGSGQTFNCQVNKEGNFTVTLEAVDAADPTNKSSAEITFTSSLAPFSVTFPSPTRQGNTGTQLTITANTQGSPTHYEWSSSDTSIAEISGDHTTTTPTITLNLHKPGSAVLTVTAHGTGGRTATDTCDITVVGITLGNINASLTEGLIVGETASLPEVLLGGRPVTNVTWRTENPNVLTIVNNQVRGVSPGTTTLTATSGTYKATLEVRVRDNVADPITPSGKYGVNKHLKFSDILSDFYNRCTYTTKESLSYITGFSVSPAQGILYLNYRSADDTGAGVAGTTRYYYNTQTGAQLKDITLVPRDTYAGDTITITYTGFSTGGRNFTGKILVSLDSPNDQTATLTGTAGEPLTFGAQLFNRACSSATGQTLRYVSFSLPSENRGILYYDYTSPTNYGYKVVSSDQFRQNQLDRLCFVPAEGYNGTVVLSYTGYSTSNTRFVGQIEITVGQSRDNGPVYNTPQGSHVVFSDSQFNDYSRSMTGRTLSYVQFPNLPDVTQGALYHNYRSSSSTGNRVYANTSYYYNSRTPQITQVSFVPASGFVGTVDIPFNAWDEIGNRFSGILQVNVRGSGSGDLTYTCTVGSSVKLVANHFNDLCLELTGKNLNYITFTSLPSTSYGSLYSNRNSTSSTSGTRVTTTTKYYRNSLGNLSFWSSGSLTGTVDIPFVGHATGSDDETFTGTVTVEILSRGQGMISYTADSKTPAVFDLSDFSDLCWDETGKTLNYVLFDLPTASQGNLYYNYNATSGSYSSKVSSTTRYYRSGGNLISRVSFVPTNGYMGTTFVTFTGYANDGTQFDGTIQITVSAAAPDATVRYTTGYAPITFNAEDFRRAYGSGTLSTIRFGSLPNSNEGHLYYQYTGPNLYSWTASTGTDYYASGSPSLSSLTFVPKAAFSGTVTIPYTATNTNNKTYAGQVVITVSQPTSSAYFTDMYGYSAAAVAAVDYLRENGVVQGMTSTQFSPESSIRRGDFALMIYRAFNFSASGSSQQAFTDVSSSAYYAQAVNTLRALNIVNGTGGNRFNPSGNVSRQDAMLMVQRALQVSGWNVSGGSGSLYYYPDRDQVSGYAQSALDAIVNLGLLPTDTGRLNPKSPLVRVDMAQVLHRALTY